MKQTWKKWVSGLVLVLAVGGCSTGGTGTMVPVDRGESEARPPTMEEQFPPFLSALRPCKAEKTADMEFMRGLLTDAVKWAEAQPYPEVMTKSPNRAPLESTGFREGSPNPMVYRTLPAEKPGDVPVIAVAFGLGVNVLDAHGLLWREDGKWRSQPYPNADPAVAEARQRVLQEGSFCRGAVWEMHQDGDLLAVINRWDGGTRLGYEVQLLQRVEDGWKLVWAPTYENWQELLETEIEFRDGIQEFVITRPEGQEVWKLNRDALKYEKSPSSS